MRPVGVISKTSAELEQQKFVIKIQDSLIEKHNTQEIRSDRKWRSQRPKQDSG